MFAKVALAFIVGMLFMHSLTGEYSRYGMAISGEIDDCELSNKECGYIIAPVSAVLIPSQLRMFELSSSSFLLLYPQIWRDPSLDTKALGEVPLFSSHFLALSSPVYANV